MANPFDQFDAPAGNPFDAFDAKPAVAIATATPPPQGLVSKAVDWIKPVLQAQGQNLSKIANLSPAQLYGPQQGYVNNMAKNILGMVNPLNVGLAAIAPETLVGRYGQVANAAMRGGVAGMGAEQVGQGLGQRTAEVPLSDEQKTQADLGIALGPAMMLGSAYRSPQPAPSNLGPTAFNDTTGSIMWEKAQAERAKQSPAVPVPQKAAVAPAAQVDVSVSPKTDAEVGLASKPTGTAVAPLNPGGAQENLSPVLQALSKLNNSRAAFEALAKQTNENKQRTVSTSVEQQQEVPIQQQEVQQKGLASQVQVQGAPQEKLPGAVEPSVRPGSGRNVQGGGREVSTEVKGTTNLTEQSGKSKKLKTETLLQQVGINPKVGDVPFNRLTRGQLGEKLQIARMVLRNQLAQNHPDRFVGAAPDVLKAQTVKFQQLLAVKNDLEKRLAFKIANTPEIGGGTTVKGPSSVPKPDKTGPESGFIIAPKELWDRVFSNKGSKADPGQMLNRLRNVFGEGSATWKALQDMGLKAFLASPKSAQEVEDWANKNAPKVEVRKFGNTPQFDEPKNPHIEKYTQLQHQLETQRLPTDEQDLGQMSLEGKLTKEQNELAKNFLEAKKNYVDFEHEITAGRQGFNREKRSSWEGIAPKSEKDMPGYVEIAVVKPHKYDMPKQEGAISQHGYSFPSSHSFPPNTLGFVRGYMEGDTFHVIEVQSDWAQQYSKELEYLQNQVTTLRDRINEEPDSVHTSVWKQQLEAKEKRLANKDVGNTLKGDPLLPHYERLALKAAIEHARSEGADSIAIQDSKSTMLQEGHDRIIDKAEKDVSNFNDEIKNDEKPNRTGYLTTAEHAIETLKMSYEKHGAKFSVDENGQVVMTVRPFEGGMDMHYDRTLPKIAEELTGSKGERVGFGEHKMAMDVIQERRGEGPITELPKQSRKDLIFRNPDGTPKTDVSARVYSLNAKPLPKEFSLYGKTGSIFPESPVSKAAKESGAVEVQPKLVEDSLKKLDSLKAFGGQVIDAVTDSNAFKAWVLKRQGYDLPKIEALNPQFANTVAKYANSQVASVLRAHANITKVLGDKADNEQFKKQLGGLIYEDMRRASGNIGNPVFKLKNSPFQSEQQYQAALKNPAFQKALAAWKQHIQPLATEMHEKLGGGMAKSGKDTGAFANLIAVLSDDRTEQVENAPVSKGPLATMKKASAFSKERKFTGQEYNLDAGDMAFRMLTKNAQQAALRDVYSEGEKAGLLKLLKPGEETPAGMVKQPNPVTLRSIITKTDEGTESANVSRWLAFDKRISPAMKQALQLNTSWKEALKEGMPALHVASQAIIKTQVGLGIDLGFHTFNDMVAVMNSGKGLLALPKKAMEVAKAQHDLVSNEQSVQEELAKMAETGISFRGESLGGWSSHALKVADTVTRLVLNREYDQLVKEGTIKDVPAERRRYINGRAGQYNKRFMTWFQQGMQETGMGSFNVAGRNFNRLAVGNLTFSPGVKASSNVDALRLRLSIAAGIATAALVIPATVNTITTGEAQPPGTQLGDIVVHKNKDGRYEVINMRKWTMLDRGARASGVGAVMRDQVMPRVRGEQPAGWGQTAYDAAKDVGRTAVAPFSGPPLNLLSVGLTGQTEGGLGYEQRTPGEKPPYLEAMAGQLNPLVGPLVQTGQGATTGTRIAQRLGSVAGVQPSQSPFSIIRNRATQWKQANNVRTDEASFAPSEYLPLKQALLAGNTDTAKEQYQQLISEKAQQHPSLSDAEAKHEAQMDLQKEFARLENFRFVTKENEGQFKASLSPEQRKMYDLAIQQQKQIADKFFAELQPKINNSAPRGFKPPTLRKARGFSKQF